MGWFNSKDESDGIGGFGTKDIMNAAMRVFNIRQDDLNRQRKWKLGKESTYRQCCEKYAISHIRILRPKFEKK